MGRHLTRAQRKVVDRVRRHFVVRPIGSYNDGDMFGLEGLKGCIIGIVDKAGGESDVMLAVINFPDRSVITLTYKDGRVLADIS